MKSVNNLKDLFYFSLLAASPTYKQIRLFSGCSEDCQNLHSVNIGLEWASFHMFTIFIFIFFIFFFIFFFCFVLFLFF